MHSGKYVDVCSKNLHGSIPTNKQSMGQEGGHYFQLHTIPNTLQTKSVEKYGTK